MTVDIEALVAVHDPRRPLERCIHHLLGQEGSLAEAGGRLRVRVVVHNTDPDAVRARVAPADADRVRWSVLHDGVRSPAGPFNRGLDDADATFVSTVGSDDVLEPDALAAWFRRVQETGADAVLAPIRVGGVVAGTPHLRPGRRPALHPVADGLAYRTAPLGLLRLDTLRRIGFRYTEGGHLTGEDVEPALRLWFSGARLAYPYEAPAYRVLDDMGAERATSTVGPLSRELGFLPPLLDQPWLRDLDAAGREAIAVKLAREQLVPGIRRRAALAAATTDTTHTTTDADATVRAWDAADADTARSAAASLRALSGNGLAALSRAEHHLVDAAGEARTAPDVVRAAEASATASRRDRVLPDRPADWLRRASRLRDGVVQQLAHRGGSFHHPAPPAGWRAEVDAAGA